MTGQDHYREAERLLDLIEDDPINWGGIAAAAQAHALLALAAATYDYDWNHADQAAAS